MANVQISKEDAMLLERLVDDIVNINDRARCSDKFFRTHFMDRIKVGNIEGTFKHLRDALATARSEAEAPIVATTAIAEIPAAPTKRTNGKQPDET